MNKKIIALIVVIILLIIIGGLAYFVNQNRNETQNSDRAQENVSEEVQTENEVISSTINTEQQNSTEENVTTETGKILVVYFSAQGHTKEVAQRIANDFNGKTVIPFCTSSSSGLGESGTLLAEEANGGNWLEGHRFRSNPSEEDVDNWTDSLK